MIEAAPMLTPRSAAICGSSESADRTIAWLAKPATARKTIARVGVWWDGDNGGGTRAAADRGWTGTIPMPRCGATRAPAFEEAFAWELWRLICAALNDAPRTPLLPASAC